MLTKHVAQPLDQYDQIRLLITPKIRSIFMARGSYKRTMAASGLLMSAGRASYGIYL